MTRTVLGLSSFNDCHQIPSPGPGRQFGVQQGQPREVSQREKKLDTEDRTAAFAASPQHADPVTRAPPGPLLYTVTSRREGPGFLTHASNGQ
eukprot:687779-Hanusia_phi.AAC.1